ncbi:MAG TPA: hypothetical protein PL043_06845, partial [Methanolinea sp.]|nr:hypothetical protein [Methanolinea sp.]
CLCTLSRVRYPLFATAMVKPPTIIFPTRKKLTFFSFEERTVISFLQMMGSFSLPGISIFL